MQINITSCRRTITMGLLAAFLSACAATSTPSIEPYTGKDSVGAVNASMFVGQWTMRALNPPEGSRMADAQATFSQDGSLVVLMADESSGINLKLQMTGRWQAVGETLNTQMESIKETSGNPLGGMLANLMTSMKDRMSGQANIYEASENRFVAVGQSGQAYEYVR